MEYNLNGKNIKIPDKEVDKLCQLLDLTQEEAIVTWLCDNDYVKDEEVEALTKKAKDNHILATMKAGDRKSRKPREVTKKENPTKSRIISAIAELLASDATVEKMEVVNDTKLITFTIEGQNYKLDLTQSRPPKAGK